MSLSFDIANDKFTRGIIRRKAVQISQRLGYSEQDLESIEQTMLTKVIKAMPSFDSEIAHRNVFITTVVERHAARLIAERSFPKNGAGHVQSLNATVAVPGDLPTELQYTLDDSIGGARLQVERKAANELNDLVSDVAIAISRLPEPWQRMLELRKTHSMVQVSELMGVPRSTLRHWMSQIAEQFEAEGLREYIA
jgi:DNA-directed RNA polymerase specialized sigma24 family protein